MSTEKGLLADLEGWDRQGIEYHYILQSGAPLQYHKTQLQSYENWLNQLDDIGTSNTKRLINKPGNAVKFSERMEGQSDCRQKFKDMEKFLFASKWPQARCNDLQDTAYQPSSTDGRDCNCSHLYRRLVSSKPYSVLGSMKFLVMFQVVSLALSSRFRVRQQHWSFNSNLPSRLGSSHRNGLNPSNGNTSDARTSWSWESVQRKQPSPVTSLRNCVQLWAIFKNIFRH